MKMKGVLVVKYDAEKLIPSKEEIEVIGDKVKRAFGNDYKVIVIPGNYELEMYTDGV